MKKLLTIVALATALLTTANAGAIVDLTVGGGTSPMGASGKLGDSATTTFDLGLDDSSQTYMYAEFDHFIPIIPNLRYEQSTYTFDGTATASATYAGITFSANAASAYSFDNEDYIAYWGLPFATWIPMIDVADFGLGLKMGEFGFNVGSSLVVSPETIGVPYGYGRLHISPPLLFGLGFGVEVKSFSFEDEDSGLTANFLEYMATVDWSIEAPIPAIELEVGVEAGYKSSALNISAGTTYMDFTFSGVFFGAFAHFGI